MLLQQGAICGHTQNLSSLNSVWRGQDYCRGSCLNLQYCSASTPPGTEIVSSLTSPKGREHKRLCSLGPGTGLEWDLCSLHPPSTLPTSPQPLPVLQCSKEAQEVASNPWKRMHANLTLSDLKRVRALPWQEKPLKNPENTDCDVGNTLLAEP